jgi:hypothetical protein
MAKVPPNAARNHRRQTIGQSAGLRGWKLSVSCNNAPARQTPIVRKSSNNSLMFATQKGRSIHRGFLSALAKTRSFSAQFSLEMRRILMNGGVLTLRFVVPKRIHHRNCNIQ